MPETFSGHLAVQNVAARVPNKSYSLPVIFPFFICPIVQSQTLTSGLRYLLCELMGKKGKYPGVFTDSRNRWALPVWGSEQAAGREVVHGL